MNIIAGWGGSYLSTVAYVGGDAAILTLFLRYMLNKDSAFKSFMLALPIALLSVLTLESLYFSQQKQKTKEIDLSIFFFLAATQIYIIAMGCFSIVGGWVEWMLGEKGDKNRLSGNLNQVIIIFNLLFALFIATFYLISFDLQQIINQQHFWLCVGATLLSALFLWVADRATAHLAAMEAIRRKIFHIGPILIIPILYYLNVRMLTLIIVAAFALLLLLQVIRYNQQLMDQAQVECHIWLQMVMGRLNVFFNWMGQFNKRERHFWFTHLYLALSLLLAYQLPQIISIKMKIPGHVVLVLIAADGLAAFVGSKYGRVKLYGNKTLQGTTVFMLACFVGSYFIVPLNNTQLGLLSIFAGLAELYGGDTDNILTLFIYYGVRLAFILFIKFRKYY